MNTARLNGARLAGPAGQAPQALPPSLEAALVAYFNATVGNSFAGGMHSREAPKATPTPYVVLAVPNETLRLTTASTWAWDVSIVMTVVGTTGLAATRALADQLMRAFVGHAGQDRPTWTYQGGTCCPLLETQRVRDTPHRETIHGLAVWIDRVQFNARDLRPL